MTSVRLLGALLLVAGGFLGGRACLAEYRVRVITLRALTASLARIRAEIALCRTPLPELLSSEAECTDGRVQAFYREALRRYGEEGRFRTSWDGASELLRLPSDARAVLVSLGDILGRYDAQTQEDALLHAENLLERCAADAENDRKQRGTLYAKLLPGLAFAAAILLW